MERKTKHRILGILVMIGLVIILLPLFESKKEYSSEATLVKAPPFPDQSVQVSAATPQSSPQSINDQQTNTVAQSAPAPKSLDSEVNQQPDDTISMIHPSIVNEKIPNTPNKMAKASAPHELSAEPMSPQPKSEAKIADIDNDIVKADNKPTELPAASAADMNNAEILQMTPEEIAAENATVKTANNTSSINTRGNIVSSKKTMKLVKTTEPQKIMTTHFSKSIQTNKLQLAALQAPLDNNGLMRLKNAAWVIQIGSFKNKANALRLVNQLRANGYRAFIQQVSNTIGNSTQVFVGPENRQTSARALASQLENDMHIRGIVISYKPLTL